MMGTHDRAASHDGAKVDEGWSDSLFKLDCIILSEFWKDNIYEKIKNCQKKDGKLLNYFCQFYYLKLF